MKKQFTYLAIGIAVVGIASVASAQVAPAPAATSSSQVAPAAPKGPVSPATAKKEKLQAAVGLFERSIEVRITNLDDIAMRLQTRIAKLQQEGKDMTAASAKLVEAQKAISEAKTEFAALHKAATTMVAAAKPATAFGTIKIRLAKNVTAKIKTAHKALVDTVVIIKGQGAATNATSTVR